MVYAQIICQMTQQVLAAGIGAKNQEWQMLADDYIVAIERAGGVPVILPVTKDIETLTPLLKS